VRAHSSSRNITAPSTRPSSIPSPQVSHVSVHLSRNPQDANDRPNTPLKAIPAAQRSRLPTTLVSTITKRANPLSDSANLAWTRSRLEKERGDWWDTQVTGSEEIWGAVKLATQYLQKGELQEAQTMLDVTGCTCPTGLLWKGVYDTTGIQYKIPEWVVVEPEGLAEEEDMHDEGVAGLAGTSARKEDMYDDDEELTTGERVSVRARTSHSQRDVVVSIGKKEAIASIVEKVKLKANVCPFPLPLNTRKTMSSAIAVHRRIPSTSQLTALQLDTTSTLRLAYGGRVYQAHELLDSNPYWNFANNHILTALVFQ
jgi:hypothetical protein